MPGYNTKFDLSVEDLDLIEAALRRKKQELAARNHDEVPDAGESCANLRGIHDLLGRIHNQKVFFRPRNAPYIGG